MKASRSGIVLALTAVLVSSAGPRATRPASASTLLFVETTDPSAGVALPAGFAATVDLATSSRFVRVVANDIDRDGDLDVVASVGTLELQVWTNDGAGHFSRLPSSTHREMQSQPPAPAADGDDLASNRWIQHDHSRGAHVDPLDARTDDGPESPLSPAAALVTGRFGPRVRSSRAPPIA